MITALLKPLKNKLVQIHPEDNMCEFLCLSGGQFGKEKIKNDIYVDIMTNYFDDFVFDLLTRERGTNVQHPFIIMCEKTIEYCNNKIESIEPYMEPSNVSKFKTDNESIEKYRKIISNNKVYIGELNQVLCIFTIESFEEISNDIGDIINGYIEIAQNKY